MSWRPRYGGRALYAAFRTRSSSTSSAELIGPEGFRQSLADGGVVTPASSGPQSPIVARSSGSSLIQDYFLILEPSPQ